MSPPSAPPEGHLIVSSTADALLSVYLPSAVISLEIGMIVPVTPIFATEFQVSPGLAAQLVTARMAGGRLFAPLHLSALLLAFVARETLPRKQQVALT